LDEFLDVRYDGNRISLIGDLRLSTLGFLTSAIYQVARIARYQDVILDFEYLKTLTTSVVPPIAAYCRSLIRSDNIDFDITLPRDARCRNKINTSGLGHFLAHRKFAKPRLKSTNPAVIQFRSLDEAHFATEKVVNWALRTASMKREHVAALEWAVTEIADNVITHSNSEVGGFIISHKMAHTNIIEFTVADAGVGVARTLGLKDEEEAVVQAVQEGVTSNKTTNQGNGLFGTFRLALESRGVFVLKSRHGNLFVTKSGDMRVKRDHVPYGGTLVVCQIDCDQPNLIDRALRFDNAPHVPAFDYIERKHEEVEGELHVCASEICKTFGSRASGAEARKYLKNMLSTKGNKLVVDFEDVNVISSSFADEVFGKLFVELGPMNFMRMVEIKNAVPTISGLIDRAITLRTQTGLNPE